MGNNRFEDTLLKFEINIAGFLSAKKVLAEKDTELFLEVIEIEDLLKDLKYLTEFTQSLLNTNNTLWHKTQDMKGDVDAVKLANVLLTEEVGELMGIIEEYDKENDGKKASVQDHRNNSVEEEQLSRDA